MKKLGFGCMRLPMNGEEVDLVEFSKMVDAYLEEGFIYFDTAKVYIQGKSELAMKECLVKRHPRNSYIIADKLSGWCCKEKEEVIYTSKIKKENCYLCSKAGKTLLPAYAGQNNVGIMEVMMEKFQQLQSLILLQTSTS